MWPDCVARDEEDLGLGLAEAVAVAVVDLDVDAGDARAVAPRGRRWCSRSPA